MPLEETCRLCCWDQPRTLVDRDQEVVLEDQRNIPMAGQRSLLSEILRANDVADEASVVSHVETSLELESADRAERNGITFLGHVPFEVGAFDGFLVEVFGDHAGGHLKQALRQFSVEHHTRAIHQTTDHLVLLRNIPCRGFAYQHTLA